MHVDVSQLTGGRTWSGDYTPDTEVVESLLDSTAVRPFHVALSATMVEDSIYLRVEVDGEVYARCDLCGAACKAHCGCVLDDELSLADEAYDAESNEYDLTSIIEEALAMSAPREARCSAECKGLCPRCGANLNHGHCGCAEETIYIGENNPFGAIKDLITGGAENGSTKV